MLPTSYETPAALLLVIGGAVSCFAGYRLFKVVLGIYGFILGAMIASSMMGTSNTAGMVLAALAGGVVGALILTLAYFVGIALVGAGLGALIAHVVWRQLGAGDPSPILVVACAIAGAIVAMMLQRYVIIVATAFGGAWTIVVAALAIMGDRTAAKAASTANVWILYPFNPVPDTPWVPLAWLGLGLLGAVVQVGVTARD